jgi:non-canonical purine NTP pyrophosphatase (RdgB/HAM1 family)
MKNITYITGNQHKAKYLAKYLGHPVAHYKLDLEEIQSLDSRQVVKHKVRQAYDVIKKSVVVEDTSLEFKALNGLPGTFIKHFLERMSFENICSLLDGKDRSATARCVFGYFDGKEEIYFEGSINGTIAHKPAGNTSFGFASIFIPEGFTVTQSELNDKDHETMYLEMKPIMQLKEFLLK